MVLWMGSDDKRVSSNGKVTNNDCPTYKVRSCKGN